MQMSFLISTFSFRLHFLFSHSLFPLFYFLFLLFYYCLIILQKRIIFTHLYFTILHFIFYLFLFIFDIETKLFYLFLQVGKYNYYLIKNYTENMTLS